MGFWVKVSRWTDLSMNFFAKPWTDYFVYQRPCELEIKVKKPDQMVMGYCRTFVELYGVIVEVYGNSVEVYKGS
jgi:hypothetical protein